MPLTIRAGQVVAPVGLTGAVKVKALTYEEHLLDAGVEVCLRGEARRVQWSRPHGRVLAVKLDGVDDRNAAESLRGEFLEVTAPPEEAMPEGTFLHHQLLGLDVFSDDGRSVGSIVEILSRPANDVWVVRGNHGSQHGRLSGEVLLPAVRDVVVSVDLSERRVVVAAWLLDEEQA